MKKLYNLFNQCARRTLFLHKTTLLLLIAIGLFGLNESAWAYVNQQYTCTGYSYSIPSQTGYTWITLKGTSFNGSFSQDVSDNSGYNEKHSKAFASAPSTWDVTATMYAKPKDDYKFVGWYSNNTGSGTALSSSTSNNCKYETTVKADKGSGNPARNFYAIFAKFKSSATEVDFGDVVLNSGSTTKTFTIDCHNVGTWSNPSGLSGIFSASLSNNKTDNSQHTCTVTVTLNPTTLGSVNQTLTVTTSRGGSIQVTVKAKVVTTYYGRAESYSSPSAGGGTYINCNGNTPSGASSYITSDYSNWDKSGQTSAPSCPAYFAALANDGYEFVGWYTGENGTGTQKSGNATYTENFTVNSTSSSSRTTIKRYAYFKALQYYYFKAQANKVGEGTVYASFSNSSFTAATANTSERAAALAQTQSTITPTAYFKAVESNPLYHFAGWFTDATCTDANRVSTNLEYSVVMSKSDKTSEATALTQTLYAKFVQELTPEIKAAGFTYSNPTNMLVGDEFANAFSFLNTSSIGSGLTVESSNENIVTYANNKITATGEGDANITFTQTKTSIIKEGTFTFNFHVDLVPNSLNLNIAATQNKLVGQEITNVIKNKNSDATVKWSSTDETIAKYDVANNKIVIPNSQSKQFESKTITIKIWQEATAKYAASGEKTITLTVTKTEPIFTLDKSALELEQTATLSFENVNGASVVFSKDGVVSYNANTGIISAVAVGETKMTVTQQQTGSIAYKQQEFNITVSKKTPTLIVKMGGAVQTNNEMSVAKGSKVTVTFEENSDADVVVTPVEGRQYASYVNGVMTAGVAGQTAKYRATLPETDTYQTKSVEFKLKVTANSSHLPMNPSNITLGSGSATDWTHSYTDISFSGIPDKLSFKYKYDYTEVTNISAPTLSYEALSDAAKKGLNINIFDLPKNWSNERKGVGNQHMLYVEASKDGQKWNIVWENNEATTTDVQSLDEPISLPDTVRYLRFHHSCNYSNTYSNISITERHSVDNPSPASIDFGKAIVNSNTITRETNVNWCNVAPVTVTSNDPRITVTPSSFGDFEQSGSQTLTFHYTPAGADETVNATITLSNGDNTYNKTISVKAATVRRPQTFTWNATLASTGFAMNTEEQYPDISIPVIATATSNGRVTFTSKDESKIKVVADTALLAVGNGKVEITAHVEGDAQYQDADSTVWFTVTALQKQSITWKQNLRGLLTTKDTVHLKARASSGMSIEYESLDTNVVKVRDSVLTIVAAGKTYVRAKQKGGKDKNGVEWLEIAQDNYVIVRNPNAQCDEVAVYISQITLSKDCKQVDSLLAGIPKRLTFSAMHGKKSSLVGGVSYSPLKVEQYSKRNEKWDWYEVFNYVVGTTSTKYGETETDEMILDESATKIRFSTLETGTTHTITNIEVSRKRLLSANVQSFDEQAETGAIWEREITVTHSNIDVLAITTKKNLLAPSVPTLGEGCGSYGNDAFKVSFTPQEKYTDYYDTIVITDGKASETHTIEIPVHLYSKGLTQAINDFNVPATALSTDANITLSATADSEETVKFATSDTTKARIVNGNELEIVAAGTVKVYAMQAGNAKYDSVAVEKTLVISKVTPVIAENEKPAAENVRYNGTWDNSLLTGGAARVTWRGVADTEVAGQFVWSENVDETITNIPNTYNRSVTFKPKDSGKFNEVTFTMPVNVLRAVSSIVVDNKTIIVSLPEESVNFDLSTLVSEHIGGGNVTFDFIDEVTTATINGVTFVPSAYGEYAIRATIAQTEYYTSETADFTVSVIEGILFDGTNTESLTADDPVIINSNVTIGYGESVEVKALTINGGNTLTIANGGKLTVGADNSFNRDAYGNIVIEAGGKLLLNEGEVHLNEFTLQSTFDSENPMSGQVFNQNKLIMHGDAYFIMDIDPSGETSYGWYKFSVPFPVDELRGITRWENNDWKPLTNEVNYAVMKYHENLRAQGKYGWKKYTGILQPGEGYSITTDTTINRYRFKKADTAAFDTCKTYNLIASEQGIETDLGWNSLGNRTMEYVSLKNAPGAVVQVYDHNTNEYHSEDATLCSFVVGAAYFVQAIENNSSFRLNASESNQTMLRAPQRVAEDNDECRISLSLMANGHKKDMLIVTCDDQAQATYTRGKDVQKMGATTGAKAARIWVNAKGTNLCAYNTAFSSNDQAIIPLNIYAPTQGEYTLKLNYQPAEEVYLRRNGIIVWNMEMGDYFADFAAGTDNSYDLLVIRHAPNTATGIDAIDSENDKNGTIFVEKIIVNDQLYILRDGTLYDAQGRVVTNR